MRPVFGPVNRLPNFANSHYFRALRRDKIALVSFLVLSAVVVCAVLAPWITPFGVNEQLLSNRLAAPLSSAPGNRVYILGSDTLGRDLLTRVFYGGRVSLSVGFMSVIISGTLGSLLGVIAGYRKGKFDDIIMRTVDLQMAFPPLLIAIFVLYAIGPGFLNVVAILAVVRWPIYARVARGLALSASEKTYVEGARSLGNGHVAIVLRHIVPNVMSPLLVLATLEFSRTVLAESALSFLGLGIQPPTPSWGRMIAESREYIGFAWWLVTVPGLAIFATALSTNLLAVWLRSAADPSQRWRLLAGKS